MKDKFGYDIESNESVYNEKSRSAEWSQTIPYEQN